MAQLDIATLQPAFDLTKGVSPAQLEEEFAKNLAPARQPLCSVLCSCLLEDVFEVSARDNLEYMSNMLQDVFTVGLLGQVQANLAIHRHRLVEQE